MAQRTNPNHEKKTNVESTAKEYKQKNLPKNPLPQPKEYEEIDY